MATRKKRRPAGTTNVKIAHSGASSQHDRIIVTIGPIGPITRIKKGKPGRGRKTTPKQVKAFLAWVLTQL